MQSEREAEASGGEVGVPVPHWSPRRAPAPGPFRGRYCTVEALDNGHADALFETMGGPANARLWRYLSDGPYLDVGAFRDRVSGAVGDPSLTSMAILLPGGQPAGVANYLRVSIQHGTVEVGGVVFGSALRRTRAATEALHLMAQHVFDDRGFRRLEWKCDSLNATSRRAALRMGFRYEGTHRQAMVYKGRNRDTAWFSITDTDWQHVSRAHRAWLDPDNFDSSGRQQRAMGLIGGW